MVAGNELWLIMFTVFLHILEFRRGTFFWELKVAHKPSIMKCNAIVYAIPNVCTLYLNVESCSSACWQTNRCLSKYFNRQVARPAVESTKAFMTGQISTE
jgi:hypothetical protein